MKAFISYKEDNGELVSGMFELIEQKENYIKISSGKNLITIPYHRVNKIKQEVKK